jgi:hypothetical protein
MSMLNAHARGSAAALFPCLLTTTHKLLHTTHENKLSDNCHGGPQRWPIWWFARLVLAQAVGEKGDDRDTGKQPCRLEQAGRRRWPLRSAWLVDNSAGAPAKAALQCARKCIPIDVSD